MNELAYEDILLSINCSAKSGKTAFSLVDNCATEDQPDGNCKLALERLTTKYRTILHSAEKRFLLCNSKLSNINARPDEWISKLESLRTQMNKIKIHNKTNISETDLVLHIFLDLPQVHEASVSKIELKLKDRLSM